MPVALAQIRDLLIPGLWGISGKYDQIERQWPKIFKQTNSQMAVERRASMRYLGLAQLKQEGGPTSFDNAAGDLGRHGRAALVEFDNGFEELGGRRLF